MKLITILENLQGVKKYHHMTWTRFVNELYNKYKIRCIGKGKFGQVFWKGGWNYVVKVFDNDCAYLDYVDFCINNPNPHYPKFVKKPLHMHQFHMRPHNSQKTMQVLKIEMLETLHDSWYGTNLHDLYDLYCGEIKSIELMSDHEYTLSEYTSIEQVYKAFPGQQIEGLLEAIHMIRQSLPEYDLDLHSGNIMQRADGTIVLSDPIAYVGAPGGMLNTHIDHKLPQTLGYISGPEYDENLKQLALHLAEPDRKLTASPRARGHVVKVD